MKYTEGRIPEAINGCRGWPSSQDLHQWEGGTCQGVVEYLHGADAVVSVFGTDLEMVVTGI